MFWQFAVLMTDYNFQARINGAFLSPPSNEENRSPSGVGTGVAVMFLCLLIWLIWSLIYCVCAICWPDDRPSCRGRPDGVAGCRHSMGDFVMMGEWVLPAAAEAALLWQTSAALASPAVGMAAGGRRRHAAGARVLEDHDPSDASKVAEGDVAPGYEVGGEGGAGFEKRAVRELKKGFAVAYAPRANADGPAASSSGGKQFQQSTARGVERGAEAGTKLAVTGAIRGGKRAGKARQEG